MGVGERLVRTLSGAVLFSMCGLCMELLFTGLWAGWGGSFLGQVSLLMIPVYALAYFGVGLLMRASERAGIDQRLLRVAVIVAAVYAIEWGAGAAYRAAGLAPWHYDHGWASDFSGGNITLYYLPFWILFALLVVPVWRLARALGPHLQEAVLEERARAWAILSGFGRPASGLGR